MTTSKLTTLLILPALLLPACVVTTTRSRTWGDPSSYDDGYQDRWERIGRVAQIRETQIRQQGDPAGGAVAGAIIGGLLGHAIGGPNSGGAVVGAIGGAAVGASASQGVAEDRIFEVYVRFQDGGAETFTYRGYLPFRVGDDVRLTPRGLARY
jgi:outer membrane lipoprotein SlyB